jgi:hypothetical protein
LKPEIYYYGNWVGTGVDGSLQAGERYSIFETMTAFASRLNVPGLVVATRMPFGIEIHARAGDTATDLDRQYGEALQRRGLPGPYEVIEA